jgi:hypothetical protein
MEIINTNDHLLKNAVSGRIFIPIRLSDRLPDMGKRVMFLDDNYEGKFMQDYHPNEKIEVKKNKFIEMKECHFATDYLKNNYTHWLEEIVV